MEKLGQLQTALRAIESGQRLEAVDGVLVRQVLLQPRPQPQPQSASAEPDTKGLYRDLLALRKASSSNAKAHLKTTEGAIAVENGAAASVVATTAASSPKRTKASRHHGQSVPETLQSTGSGSPERHGSSNNRPDTAEAMAAEAAHTTALLQTALATRGHELLRSEYAAALADAELRVELRRAEKLLPSKFLFERNLAGDRAIDAARQVLLRFQHRFYQLYFHHWWAATLELRLVAQRRAATEIARVCRGHRARHQAQLLRRERSVMADQRRQLLAFRIKFRGSQALKLQMAWRRFLWHRAATRRQQRQTAAKLLQRAFRTRQWRRQSLVSALADARRLVAAVSLQRLFRGHRARLTLQHTRPKPALVASELERRGAAFVIAYRGTFPYAMRRRWRSVLELLRRQRAARCVGAAVCRWFGVEARRQAARTRQLGDHPGSRRAAILIQKHVRRWLQQRKFLLAETSRKESAKRDRLAEKARRMELVGQHQASGRLGAGRKASPPRLSSLLPFAQLKKIGRGGGSPTEVGAARCVQRWYRRRRARWRAKLAAWRMQAQRVEARVLARRQAATQIQRRVRGIHGRLAARQRRAERMLLRFVRRWKTRRVRVRQVAGRKIARWLEPRRARQLARRRRVERQRRLTAACRVQRWARQHYLLRLGLDRLLRLARKREEAAVFCDQSLRVCRQHAADGLAVQSLGAGLEEALRPLLAESLSPSKAKASPSRKKTLKLVKARPVVVAFPVLQLCFLVASGWKTPFVWREVDGKTLFQTKLERAKAVALLRSLRKRDATGAGSPTKGQQSPGSTSPSRRGPKTSAAKGAKPSDVFSPVDVDVALAKAMGGSKGALDFAAFLRVLGFLGELALTQQPQQPQQPPRGSALCWGRYDGTEARVLALLWRSLLPLPSFQDVALQFEACVSDELARRAARLQRLFIRRHNKLQGAAMLVEKRLELRNEELRHAAVLLQAQARRLLACRVLRLRAQETYEKLLDPTWGRPYWRNPRSGFSSWQKPRVLGAGDVNAKMVPCPLPERSLQARCDGRLDCDRCVRWLCLDCDEFFCLDCLAKYHRTKGKARRQEEPNVDSPEASVDPTSLREGEEEATRPGSREHELERLQLCGLCQFQLASRRCLDCAPTIPSGSELEPHETTKLGPEDEERTPEGDDGGALFCDACFAFVHRLCRLQTHRIEALLELCSSCLPQPPSGVGDPATGDAVQWECEACGAPPHRVCGRCALREHPEESCGALRAVPLQTSGRRQRAKRLQDARDRADADKRRVRELQALQERSARQLQTFWRLQSLILRARREAATRRRAKWLRRQEDAQLAKRLGYRAKDALGIAPALSSDSPVERRLRGLHALARRQLASRAKRLGLRLDEYVAMGIPLPGLGLLRAGSSKLRTSEDLRGWVRNWQTLRLRKLTPQDAEPAERAFCAWRLLQRWSKRHAGLPGPGGEAGGRDGFSALAEAPGTWLVDIHAEKPITDGFVPLLKPYEAPGSRPSGKKAAKTEDVPVAMFLVEFSLDPKRTVWLNHSLPERLGEWKRLKLLARSEHAAQQQRAKEKQQQQERDAKEKERELRALDEAAKTHKTPGQDDAATTADRASPYDPGAAVSGPGGASHDAAWQASGLANAEAGDPDLSTPQAASDGGQTPAVWTGYDSNYEGYTGQETAPGPAAGLVDGGSYYASNGTEAASSSWNGAASNTYETPSYPDGNAGYGSSWEAYASTGSPVPDWTTGDCTTGTSYDQYQQSGTSAASAMDPHYDCNSHQAAGDCTAQWEEVFDPETSQAYYVNRLTGETAWELPAA